jgi:hypothetical protein
MSTDVSKKSALEVRTDREAWLAWDNLVLWIALILLFLGFVPQARVVIGYSLEHIGTGIQNLGLLVVQEQAKRSGTTEASASSFPFKWIIGLAVLLLPALLYRFGYIFGWSQGMCQAQGEARDYHARR